jgi:hypothetical protein
LAHCNLSPLPVDKRLRSLFKLDYNDSPIASDITYHMLVFVFIISIICLLALDLGLVHRRIQHISYYEALPNPVSGS